MPDQLLKRWADWSAGIGHLVDDGRTPGMYYASGLLGLRGELRPAPFFNVADINEGTVDFTWTFASDGFAASCIAVEPAAFGTAVTINGTPSSDNVGANTTLTFAHTVAAGTNRVLFVGLAYTNGTVSSVTFNGDALTLFPNSAHTTGAVTVAIYYRVAPDVATGNVVVTMADAEDIAGVAIALDGVSQTSPFLPLSAPQTHGGAAGTSATVKATGSADGMALAFLGTDDQNPAGTQTEIAEENVVGSLYLNAQRASFVAGKNHFQYFFEEPETADSVNPFLYAIRQRTDGVKGVYLRKVILANTGFGTVHPGGHIPNTSQLYAGQPARYQGKWYIPAYGAIKPIQLTTVGAGDVSTDAISTVSAGSTVGGSHLANLGHQLIIVREGSGVSILKVDGAVTTDADWGSFFPVGDKEERAAGVRGLEGLSFVMNVEGLYSFNSKGRSRLVFEDFRAWRHIFGNILVSAWRGGLLIPHPSGLLYYVPGERPINVGIESRLNSLALPPSGPTELHGGRYHSTAPVGDFVWGVYQPDPSSTSALILVAYSLANDPTDLVWQGVGAITLQDADVMLGCGVVLAGRPRSSGYVTPTFWCGNGADLGYVTLDPRSGPFRSRSDTHKVNISADAYMSEVFFTEPMRLTRLVVRTSADMADGDEFQISIIADGTGREENVGPPVKGSGTHHPRKLDRHAVSRMILHVNWTATSTADRVPPVITGIELYGGPEKETASAP